ncbi:MAG: hypothetical protein ACTHL1_00455, partial [Burkholderiaceae bacterium]
GTCPGIQNHARLRVPQTAASPPSLDSALSIWQFHKSVSLPERIIAELNIALRSHGVDFRTEILPKIFCKGPISAS